MKRIFSVLLIVLLLSGMMCLPASAQVVNVKDYGAVGDGVTDDSPAVNAALNAAQSGDTVYFPAGRYNLTQVIKLKHAMKVIGESKETAVLSWSSLDVSKNFIYGGASVDLPENPRNMEIANLTIDGNNILSDRSGALLFEHTSGINIHDTIIMNIMLAETGQNAIHFKQNVDNSRIVDNAFYNIGVNARWGEPIEWIQYPQGKEPWGAAMRIAWGSENVTVSGNTIENTGRGGILCNNGASGLIIRGNVINGSGINSVSKDGDRAYMGLGIELWSGCDNSIVEDNQVDQWVSIVRCDRVAVRRNRVEETQLQPLGDHERDYSYRYKNYGYEINTSNSIFTNNYSGNGHRLGLSMLGSGVGDSDATPCLNNYFGNNVFENSMQWGAQFFGQNNLGIEKQYFYQTDFIGTQKNIQYPVVSYDNLAGTAIRIDGNSSFITFDTCKFNGGREGIGFCGRPGLDYFYFTDCEIQDNVRLPDSPSNMFAGDAISSYWDTTNQKGFSGFETNNMTVSGNERNTIPVNIPFGNELPVASFAINGPFTVGQTIGFVSTSSDSDDEIVEYLWDFGDGLPETDRAVSHVYTKPGTYEITLIVWDSFGRSARASKTITVNGTTPYTVSDVQMDAAGKVSAAFQRNEAGRADDFAVAVAYGEDGRMLDYNTQPIDGLDDRAEVQLSLPQDSLVTQVKLFIWNISEGLLPLSNAPIQDISDSFEFKS